MAQLASILLQGNRLRIRFSNSKHQFLNNGFRCPFLNGELG